MSSPPRYIFLAFLSGFAGLGAESVFLKLLDFSVGSAPLVSFVVVACFILGAAIGNLLAPKVARPWKIEFLLALFCAGWLFFLPQFLALNAALLGQLIPLLGANLAPALLAGAYLAFPTLALGLSFPILSECLGSGSRAFLWHSLGALAGLLAMETLLFPRYGIPGTLAALLLAHAGAALLFRPTRLIPLPAKKPAWKTAHRGLLIAGIGTGGVNACWLFLAGLLFRPLYLMPPLVIASMLLGLWLGTLAWHRFRWSFATALRLTTAGILASFLLAVVFHRLGDPFSYPLWRIIVTLPLLILPFSLTAGSLFPAATRELAERSPVASLNFSLSAGNFLGLLGFQLIFLVLPLSWGFVAGIGIVLLALGMTRAELGRAPGAVTASATVAGAVGLAFLMTDSSLMRLAAPWGEPARALTVLRGPGSLTGTFEHPNTREYQDWPRPSRRIYQNGLSAVNLDVNQDTVLGAVPAAYADRRERALSIGFGSGRTVGWLARVFEQLDVVEISPESLALGRALPGVNYGANLRPNVRLHLFDGLLAPYYFRSRPTYDFIILNISPSFYQVAAKLFTREYFLELKKLLKPGGVFAYWVTEATAPDGIQVLLNTGRAAFKHQKLMALERHLDLNNDYFSVIQSDAPLLFQPGSGEAWTSPPEVHEALTQGEPIRLRQGPEFGPQREVNSVYRPYYRILLGHLALY